MVPYLIHLVRFALILDYEAPSASFSLLCVHCPPPTLLDHSFPYETTYVFDIVGKYDSLIVGTPTWNTGKSFKIGSLPRTNQIDSSVMSKAHYANRNVY